MQPGAKPMNRLGISLLVIALILVPGSVLAVTWCGGVQDNCQCGAGNPYPCCDNGYGRSSNCTWGAWRHACCDWGKGLPGWSHAKYWAGNAAAHPDYEVHASAVTGSIACRDIGYYGHVAWVTQVNGGSITVHEMSCCEGTACWPDCSYCIDGYQNKGYQASWYTGGYIKPKGAVNPVCGDGKCNGAENCANCSQDCGACCGNGVCDNAENCSSCSQDCGACCGNGACDNGEKCGTCPADCGNCCGNGKCGSNETCKTCPADCGACCPNGNCGPNETCSSCPQDCGPCCGNGKCGSNETCKNCPADCGPCCPNGNCGSNETCSSCPQDCGSCCGNGKCDNAETCASCEQDCGKCNHPPVGKLEVVNCLEISGWALDPDVDGPISVRVLCNGNEAALMPAAGGHPVKPGHGFKLLLDHELKNGEVYTVEVVALDDLGELDGAIEGSGKKFRCRNHTEQMGLWTIVHQDSAGVDVVPVALGEEGMTAVQVRHPGGLDYPLSGRVSAGMQMGVEQFDEVTATLCGGFSDPRYAAFVSLDGEAIPLGVTGDECQAVSFVGPGSWFEVSLEAKEMVVDPEPHALELRTLTAHRLGWEYAYSGNAQGLTVTLPTVDSPGFLLREKAENCAGLVRVRRDFDRHFGGVSFQPQVLPGPHLNVSTDSGAAIEVTSGPSAPLVLDDFPGQILELTLDCAGGAAGEQWAAGVEKLRVFDSYHVEALPWEHIGERAWGLESLSPEGADSGLRCLVRAAQAGYPPTGAVRCETAFPPPAAEAVAGVLNFALPGQCYRGFVTVDGQPVKSLSYGEAVEPLKMALPAERFGIALGVESGCIGSGEEAFVEVSSLSYLREGWWTLPSSQCAGIRDTRPSGCAIGFENLRWWGMEENEAMGSLLVHRTLVTPALGFRYRLAHDFEAPFFTLKLLLDGKPVREYPLNSPETVDEVLEDLEFSEIAFLFGVTAQGVFPYRWQLALDKLEVMDSASGWRSICEYSSLDVPGAQDAFGAAPEVTAVPEGGEPVEKRGSPSGGCRASTGGSPQGASTLLPMLFCLVLMWTFIRPREPRLTG